MTMMSPRFTLTGRRRRPLALVAAATVAAAVALAGLRQRQRDHHDGLVELVVIQGGHAGPGLHHHGLDGLHPAAVRAGVREAHPNVKLNIVTYDGDANGSSYLQTKMRLFNRAGTGWPDVVFACVRPTSTWASLSPTYPGPPAQSRPR